MRRGLIVLGMIVVLLVAVASVQAHPQRKSSGKASLSGTVLGPDDRPVPHAAVTYQSSGGNAPHAVHSDAHGHFTIAHLRGDNYDMRASANGIFSEWEKNISVRPGEQKTVVLRLIYAREMPKSGGKKR
jgi:Carboxypeptidase regulatory-like domain